MNISLHFSWTVISMNGMTSHIGGEGFTFFLNRLPKNVPK